MSLHSAQIVYSLSLVALTVDKLLAHVAHCYVVPPDAAQQHIGPCSHSLSCRVAIRGTGQASLASVRELLRGERFALSAAEVERLVQQLGVANDSDVLRYDEWAAAMISWKTVRVARSLTRLR